MKTNQKGLSTALIVIIIAILLIGVGVYFISNKTYTDNTGVTKTDEELSSAEYTFVGDDIYKGFKINYPKDWSVKVSQGSLENQVTINGTPRQLGYFEARISPASGGGQIIIYHSDYPEDKFSHSSQETFDEYMKKPYFKQYIVTPLTLNGIKGYVVDKSKTSNGGVGQEEWDNGVYRIVFQTSTDVSPKNIELMQKTRATFQFLK